MTTTTHVEPNYNAIFWWLLALTIVELAVANMPSLGRVTIGALLVALALGKAALVAMFFMHLRFERMTLGVIALTPLVLCVFLLLMLMPDSNPLHREAVAEGHAESAAVAE
jgi:cytochrome c oxidase subunit 4